MPNQKEGQHPQQQSRGLGRRELLAGATGGAIIFIADRVFGAFGGRAGADVPPPSPSASPSIAPSVAPSVAPNTKAKVECPPGGFPPEDAKLSDQVASRIPVPSDVSNQSEVPFAQLNANSPQRKWFHPIYDQSRFNEKDKWVGGGPWAPIYIDGDAATLQTHGNPGEFIIRQKSGGRVTVGVMQLQKYQDQTKYSSETGSAVQNPDWTNQYTFKGMMPGTEIRVVDPDTGKQHLWPDGATPVIYTPSKNGDFSVEIPRACGDVRVAFSFTLPSPTPGTQLLEIKVERGANNHPELQGEVPLPKGVIKTAIAGQN